MEPVIDLQSLRRDLPSVEPRDDTAKRLTLESLPNEILRMIICHSNEWALLDVSRRFRAHLDVLPEETLVAYAKEVLFDPSLERCRCEACERCEDDDCDAVTRSSNESSAWAHHRLRRLLRSPRVDISIIRRASHLWLKSHITPVFELYVSMLGLSVKHKASYSEKFARFMLRATDKFDRASGLLAEDDVTVPLALRYIVPWGQVCFAAKINITGVGLVTCRVVCNCPNSMVLSERPTTSTRFFWRTSLTTSRGKPEIPTHDEYGRAVCEDTVYDQKILQHRSSIVPPELIWDYYALEPERRAVLRYALTRLGTRHWAFPPGSELAAAGARIVSQAIERADLAVLSDFTGVTYRVYHEPSAGRFYGFHQRGFPEVRRRLRGMFEPWTIADGRAARENKRLVTLDLARHVPALLRNSDKFGTDWLLLLLIAAFYHGEWTPRLHCFPWADSKLPSKDVVSEELKGELLDGLARLVERCGVRSRDRRQFLAMRHWLAGGRRWPADACYVVDEVRCYCGRRNGAELLDSVTELKARESEQRKREEREREERRQEGD